MSLRLENSFRVPLAALVFALACLTGVGAADAAAPARDVLVYKDGDRVQGRLLRQEGNVLVFSADRFGELRVPADSATVVKAGAPAAPLAAVPPPAPAPAAKPADPLNEDPAAASEHAASKALAAKVRNFFGPWTGRLAASTEVISDTSDRSTLSVEAKLNRKWKLNELQLNARYDYSETNTLTTTDMIKADGLWRHTFAKNKNGFTQYRPAVEWNRASRKSGVPADYVLLQQEIGAGISLLTTPARKLRVGVSENLFDVWTTSPPSAHNSRTAESAFVETELRLPWGLLLTDRGVYYYSFSTQSNGWENRIELTKKFSAAFSTALRHETRQGSPDGTAQDYTRLKLLLGLDF